MKCRSMNIGGRLVVTPGGTRRFVMGLLLHHYLAQNDGS